MSFKLMRRRYALVALTLIAGHLSALLPADVASAAGPRPAFQLPFRCGEQWRLDTWGHYPALDMVKEPNQVGTEGSPVLASAAGTVRQSFFHSSGGNLVQIDHGGGWFTTSIHLGARSVEVGQRVEQGQQIGTVGRTGSGSNDHPHLHFEQAIDANGDGRASWGAAGTERVQVFFDGTAYGTGNSQTFRNVTSRNCPGGGGHTQFADLDGNGRDEIVDVRDNGDVVAFRNLNGDWSSGLPIYDGGSSKLVAQGGFRPSSTRFADLDGDGRDEIVDVRDNGDVLAFRNLGGSWSGGVPVYDGGSSKLVAQGGFRPRNTQFGDLDGDGRDEIIDVRDNGDVLAFRNLSGSWAGTSRMYDGGSSRLVASGGFRPGATRFADLDGDRRDEIVDVRDNGDVLAFRNLGGGWSGGVPVYDGGSSKVVAQGGFRPGATRFADLDDEDWRQEIVDVRDNGDVLAFRNLSGSWADTSRMYDGGSSRLVASGGFRP